MATSYLNQSNLPRGIRNNNPGNLVITPISWQGKVPISQNKDGHFEQFMTLPDGIRAMAMDMTGDIRKGANTIRKLITQYAPSFENDTTGYINFVSKQTGIAPDAFLTADTTTIKKLIKANIQQENGISVANKYISDANIDNGINLLPAAYLLPGIITTAVKQNPGKSTGILLFFGLASYGVYKWSNNKNKK